MKEILVFDSACNIVVGLTQLLLKLLSKQVLLSSAFPFMGWDIKCIKVPVSVDASGVGTLVT